MCNKKVFGVAVVGQGLADRLKDLPPGGTMKTTVPPKNKSEEEVAASEKK